MIPYVPKHVAQRHIVNLYLVSSIIVHAFDVANIFYSRQAENTVQNHSLMHHTHFHYTAVLDSPQVHQHEIHGLSNFAKALHTETRRYLRY